MAKTGGFCRPFSVEKWEHFLDFWPQNLKSGLCISGYNSGITSALFVHNSLKAHSTKQHYLHEKTPCPTPISETEKTAPRWCCFSVLIKSNLPHTFFHESFYGLPGGFIY